MKQRVLFVDDDPGVLDSYQRSSRGQRRDWDMTFVDCPILAWNHVQQEPFDTIVADVRMPRLTGLELLVRVKQDERTRHVPVIIVTGEADRCLKYEALELGAADLLNKPVDRNDLLARIRNSLRLKQNEDELRQQNRTLDAKVRARTAELSASRLDIIWRLGKAAEFRDEQTGNHVIRVGCYSRIIAGEMGMNDAFVDAIFLAAPLHDIGKIGVPDSVLLKPGKLTADEWTMMRGHCEMGVSILADECKFANTARRFTRADSLAGNMQSQSPALKMASEIARSHHEQWLGGGYPGGLAGDDIPLPARIVAIADVYDALRSARPYKEPCSVEQSLEILGADAGRHFDPQVHSAFLSSFPQIQEIENEFSDPPDSGMSSRLGMTSNAGEVHDQFAVC